MIGTPCFVWGALQKYMFLFKYVLKLWGYV